MDYMNDFQAIIQMATDLKEATKTPLQIKILISLFSFTGLFSLCCLLSIFFKPKDKEFPIIESIIFSSCLTGFIYCCLFVI